jgi:hypothetical protein
MARSSIGARRRRARGRFILMPVSQAQCSSEVVERVRKLQCDALSAIRLVQGSLKLVDAGPHKRDTQSHRGTLQSGLGLVWGAAYRT